MLRPKLLILIASIASSAFVWAQNNTEFGAGAILGINTSQISGDNLAGFNKPSPIAGMYVNRYFQNKLWGLQMEMYYLAKGSRKNQNPEIDDYTLYRLNIHYIEVPLLLLVPIKEKVSIEGGLSGGVLLWHYEGDEFGDMRNSYNSQQQFKPFDFSAMFGVNVQLHERWVANVRFSNSILPVRNHFGNATFRLNGGQLHSCLALRFYYRFR